MTDLTSLQASVLASELNLAKTMATKSINNTNDYIIEIEKLRTEIYTLNNKVTSLVTIINDLTQKVDNLTNNS